jgi:protein tyrosine phosphatase (PTP) superfamily phosphohydrolase (DUF442 family)
MINKLLESIPFEYSQINDNLYIGTTPKSSKDYKKLKDLGVKLVINMRVEHADLNTYIKTLWVPTFDSKFLPIRYRHIKRSVKKANKVIRNNGKVYVYCRAGRHRSLIMCSSILISQGLGAEEAISLIKSKRPKVDPEPKHIVGSIKDFEKHTKRK